MALLKFRCKACDAVFDALIAHDKIAEVACEACGGEVSRAYEGACLFGMAGSSAGRQAACSHDCSGCGGCASAHADGCQCGGCH